MSKIYRTALSIFPAWENQGVLNCPCNLPSMVLPIVLWTDRVGAVRRVEGVGAGLQFIDLRRSQKLNL